MDTRLDVSRKKLFISVYENGNMYALNNKCIETTSIMQESD